MDESENEEQLQKGVCVTVSAFLTTFLLILVKLKEEVPYIKPYKMSSLKP